MAYLQCTHVPSQIRWSAGLPMAYLLCTLGLQDECESAVARIRCSQHLEELGGSDFVVEAVAESEGLKRDVFERLDDVTPPHAILASNTSSISITVMGAATTRPGKVRGPQEALMYRTSIQMVLTSKRHKQVLT